MSRQWKPGDVGVNPTYGYRSIYVESCPNAEHGRGGRACWHNESGFSDPGDDIRRPLLVIDPEDREQVERLLDAYDGKQGGWDKGTYIDRLSDALRSLVTPPKPPEPQGLGAVVRDVVGRLWVRHYNSGGSWVSQGTLGPALQWQSIDVVDVLSEGVQP